jgi:hypothetical protein
MVEPFVQARAGSRRDPRYGTSWPALWHSSGQDCTGTVLDISVGGAFVAPKEGLALPAGADLELKIVIGHLVPDPTSGLWRFVVSGSPLEVSGVVRWVGVHEGHRIEGVGLEFPKRFPLHHLASR